MRRLRAAAAVAALVFVAAACGGGSKHAKNGTMSFTAGDHVSAVTTKPKPRVFPRAPLTGLPDPTGQSQHRPALTVKIENLALSHPQTGIDAADLVYEEVVECNITRLAAIFQSRVPAVIGPVRSVRNTDQALVRTLRGIFVYSGGAPISIRSIETAPVVLFDESRAGDAMYRDPSRGRPHNLYLRAPQLYAKATNAVGPPLPQFTYGTVRGGRPATHVVVQMSNDASFNVVWDWDATSHLWLRSVHGHPDVTTSGARLGFANVIIHPVHYGPRLGGQCGDEGAQADLQSTTPVTILTGGKAVTAQWSQPDLAQPGVLRDARGARVALTPGATWIELPKPDEPVTITP